MSQVVTNDGVTGGLSQGKVRRTEDETMIFAGTLSLENNGGFSSWTIADGKWDFSASKGIGLKVRGDGRTYNLRLATDERFRFSPVAFQASFTTVAGEWTVVKIPFADLKASWRGQTLKNAFDPAKIETVGVILSDKNRGDFQVELKEVWAWTPLDRAAE